MAESIDPQFYLAQGELAILYHILRQLPEAQIHFEFALRSDPLSNRANEQLVAIYEKRGMWEEARSLIQKNEGGLSPDRLLEFRTIGG